MIDRPSASFLRGSVLYTVLLTNVLSPVRKSSRLSIPLVGMIPEHGVPLMRSTYEATRLVAKGKAPITSRYVCSYAKEGPKFR